jgi:predicted Co/Zn/Cd cation transporter (cation efflux family)
MQPLTKKQILLKKKRRAFEQRILKITAVATADVFKYALIFGLASPVINLDFDLVRIAAAVALCLFAYLLVILFNLFID